MKLFRSKVITLISFERAGTVRCRLAFCGDELRSSRRGRMTAL